MGGKLKRNLSTPEMRAWWQSVDDAARQSREADELFSRHRAELAKRRAEAREETAAESNSEK